MHEPQCLAKLLFTFLLIVAHKESQKDKLNYMLTHSHGF